MSHSKISSETMTVLETERLILKPLELADAPTTQRLFPHWEIVRYLNAKVPWPYPADGALQFYRDVVLPAVARGEQWIWAIHLKDGPDHLIGAINLTLSRDENRGFWLGLPWQRQGLMSEACEIVTDTWFDALGQDVLKVSKAAPNVASHRVSEKQGARLVAVEERDYVSGRWPTEIWELTRLEWHARRG
jgi:[ribosomal protein S5]-alanine N-acetyltransferase